MGKLAEAAGRVLKGPVSMTFEDGTVKTFDCEADAEAALPSGCALEYRRGGFVVKAKTVPKKKREDPKSEGEGEGG